MRLLLDTQAFLWFIWTDARLSAMARALIQDPNNTIFLSSASCWEIAIKVSTRKLALNKPLDVFILEALQQNGFDILAIEVAHAAVVATLPFHHRDPFDRMLVAQSLAEKMPVISVDAAFDAYGVTRLS
jgi:PIN domain nuclease of toxin-antitoxin system